MLNKIEHMYSILDFSAKIAKQQYVDDFEIQILKSQSYIINVTNLKPDKIELNVNSSFFIKVYYNQSVGYANTADLNFSSLESTIIHAKTIARYTEKDNFSGIVNKNFLCKPMYLSHINKPWNDFDINKSIDLLKTCERYGFNNKYIIKSDGANLHTATFVKGIINSHGFCNVFQETKHSISIGFIAKDMYGMQQDYSYFNSRDFNLIPNVKKIASIAVNRVLSKRNPRKIKSQVLPIILEPRVAQSFIQHLLSAINGSAQYNKSTCLLKSLNNVITNKNINIVEDPNIIGAIGSQPYDSEGVNKGKNPVIMNGKLLRYLLDTYNGRRLNMETTGNAGGISNIIVSSNNYLTKRDIIKTVKQCIVVCDIMGHGIDIVTGNYSQAASGYYMSDGELKYSVNNVVVVSNLIDMLNNIKALSYDNIDKNSRIQVGSILIDNCFISCK